MGTRFGGGDQMGTKRMKKGTVENTEQEVEGSRKWHTELAYEGVRFRVHRTRKVKQGAVARELDKYFAIRYQKDGKRMEEGLGWVSEGWTAEKAFAKLVELKDAAKRHLDAPRRLKDERERNTEVEREREEERKRTARQRLTFGEFFIDTYWPVAKGSRKNPDNKANCHDMSHYNLWLKDVVGFKTFSEISQLDAERIKKSLVEAGRSPRTVQHVLSTFRQAWNFALELEIAGKMCPAKKTLKKLDIDNERWRFLSREEAIALLQEIRVLSIQAYHMSALGMYTGLRASELFGLIWRRVDRKNGRIYIGDPKNKKSRFAYITAPVAKILDEMEAGEPSDYLFLNEDGVPFKQAPSAFRNAVRHLKLNDGITDRKERVCFHTLRHTFGSWLAQNGVPLLAIKELMGHKTLAMTERYAHLGETAAKKAAMTLEELDLADKLTEAA